MAEQMANELRLPLVRLVDGTGGGGSIKSLEEIGRTYVPANPGWEWSSPTSAPCRSSRSRSARCAGLGAARRRRSHYSVMVKGPCQVFVAGPPVVARLGENVDQGGARRRQSRPQRRRRATRSTTEDEAFERTRRFLSYLPPRWSAGRAHRAATTTRARATTG